MHQRQDRRRKGSTVGTIGLPVFFFSSQQMRVSQRSLNQRYCHQPHNGVFYFGCRITVSLSGAGLTASEILKNLNINSSNSSQSQRANLFQELISLQAEKEGLANQARTLNEQISELENRLVSISKNGSQLRKLQRELQLAEAVFSSTATKLELSKSQNSASYPPMSLFAPPSLPKTATSPKTELVVLGSLFSSLLLTTGLFTLWWRNKGNLPLPYPQLGGSQNNRNGNHNHLTSVSEDKITVYKP